MLKKIIGTTVLASAVLTAGNGGIAHAAIGGDRSDSNPGIIALTDKEGNQVCSAVLINPDWALTFEGPLTCSGASQATSNGHRNVGIDRQETEDQDPGNGQAMLVHFDEPITDVTPAPLSDEVPKKGETLQIAAFNGNEGINHLLSIGISDITVKGHNEWISWYGSPKSFTLETGKDSGALIMRNGKVVGFTGLVTQKSADAEDIANVHEWVNQVTSQGNVTAD